MDSLDSMNTPETLEALAADGTTPGRLGPLAEARLRRLSPLLVRMGPVTLTLSCLALIGLMAMVYLGQVGAATAANAQLLDLQARHAQMVRRDQALHQRLGEDQSPAYIDRRARELGLQPAPPGTIKVIAVPEPGAQP
jgi:cell division protein FtsB